MFNIRQNMAILFVIIVLVILKYKYIYDNIFAIKIVAEYLIPTDALLYPPPPFLFKCYQKPYQYLDSSGYV